MKYVAVVFGLLTFGSAFGQTSAESPDESASLRERFQFMKAKSQTYGEYKVIKEVVLDGVWKITTDSIKSGRVQFADARTKITSLETELKNTQVALQQKAASMEEIEYAGTHISVLGISFEKATFVSLVGIIIAGLLVFVGVLSGKMKSMYVSIREKIELINTTTNEYEDYKRKSLDKQTKLSRELQNERNKLMEIKRT